MHFPSSVKQHFSSPSLNWRARKTTQRVDCCTKTTAIKLEYNTKTAATNLEYSTKMTATRAEYSTKTTATCSLFRQPVHLTQGVEPGILLSLACFLSVCMIWYTLSVCIIWYTCSFTYIWSIYHYTFARYLYQCLFLCLSVFMYISICLSDFHVYTTSYV